MPLNTVMPIDLRALAPAPLEITSGKTPSMKANDVKRPHGREGADDRHRHRCRRDQHGAPVLEKDRDDQENQHGGFNERLVDFADRLVDEYGGIERRRGGEALRKYARQLRHLGFDGLLHLQGVGARQLEDADAGRRLPLSVKIWL